MHDINTADVDLALRYINAKWDDLVRFYPEDNDTLIGLPRPYVIPSTKNSSGFAFEEIYYWDSYFIAQGLIRSGRPELAEGMLEDLLYLADRFGSIPNGSRYYLTGRSHPPFLTSYILDIYKINNDKKWLKKAKKVAEDEYEHVWMSDLHPNWRNVFHGLSRYYDINVLDKLAECESGWDMTTRFNDECLSYIPIDLNCLLYKYEMDFAEIAGILGEVAEAEVWKMRAKNRTAKVSYYLWDEKKGFFFDYNYKTDKLSDVWSLASYYALWSGLASKEQAERLVDNLDKFICKGGLSATSEHSHSPLPAGHYQWAYPNGWAPLHWIVIRGLEKYGYNVMAEYIATKWIDTNTQYFADNGIFREAYNVIDPAAKPEEGLYPPQEGYGWTNAVYIDLVKDYLDL
ncbi:hypothetical protein A3F37_00665 [Candidatus Saccharibacteria bacterium RIFCSPHIGHO2_12_FULL_41_12]|nr:MAG: hypothetical protein A3F37_00665 [Candidatus Saccharibacteria bacterium RIFCSPHIGHO2_12_FULL_41_12]